MKNVYDPHPLLISSGEFWRCDHGNTGLGKDAEWVGCVECKKVKAAVYRWRWRNQWGTGQPSQWVYSDDPRWLDYGSDMALEVQALRVIE